MNSFFEAKRKKKSKKNLIDCYSMTNKNWHLDCFAISKQ